MNPSAFPAIFPSTATGAMLVMISSMSGDSNSPAMKIINAKYDDGTDVVKKFNWVQSCVACKRKGVPEKCSHIRREPQHFQDLASQARLSKLMDPRAYAIEVLNESEEALISFAFESAWIDAMITSDYLLNEDIPHLFITIDPSAGKDRNLYVLCSTVFTRDGTCVIIGAECINSSDALLVAEVIALHIEACKKIKFLRFALPIIIPESNLPDVARNLNNMLKHALHVKCQFMNEDKSHAGTVSDLPGSYTTHRNKIEMVNLMMTYMKSRTIVFYKEFVVAASDSAELTSNIDVRKEFERQLRDFARIKKYKTDRSGAPICEFFYNGKTSGANDDFVMSLLIAGLMRKRFNESEKYRGLRSK